MLAILWGLSFVIFLPLKYIAPESGFVKPVIRLNRVVFPAPFGPIRPRVSPATICRLKLSTATIPPNRLLRLFISRIGSVGIFPLYFIDRTPSAKSKIEASGESSN